MSCDGDSTWQWKWKLPIKRQEGRGGNFTWKEGIAALWKSGPLVVRRNRGYCCCIREVEKPWMWREERPTIWEAVGRSKEEAIRRPDTSSLQRARNFALNHPRKTSEEKPESWWRWRRRQGAWSQKDDENEEQTRTKAKDYKKRCSLFLHCSSVWSESDGRL